MLWAWSLLLIGCLSIISANAAESTEADRVVGFWRTEGGKGLVEIYADPKQPGLYLGRIASGKSGPEAPLDQHNPDPALRSRPLLGLTFMTGFRYEALGRYVDGQIYDPNSGNTYQGKLRLQGQDELVLRGYLGFSLFGSSQTWKRVSAPESTARQAP